MRERTKELLIPVCTRQSSVHSKVHKSSLKNCLPFQAALLAWNIPTYELSKNLVPVLKPLESNKFTVISKTFTVKDYFHFVDQQPGLLLGRLNKDSRYTNILLEEIIEFFTK